MLCSPTGAHAAGFAPLHPPSAWIQRWSHLIAGQGDVLDIACGPGRHMQWLSDQGLKVTGVDRSPEALQSAARFGNVLHADIENGPWPFAGREFSGVVVTNYLWRALFPDILKSLAPGGVLIYETFTLGNETVGKPSRPEFLLRPGELLELTQGLRVIAYEDGFLSNPERFVQRIVARREAAMATEVFRASLT